jgi:heptaprenylglyceryl phosphate synthase
MTPASECRIHPLVRARSLPGRTAGTATDLPRLLPLLDPEHFGDVAFYRELVAIGFRKVLLGGTGSARLRELIPEIRRETELQVVLYPAGPDAVCEADLVILPDIMNSSAPHARPFGTGALMTAMAVARTRCPWLAVAHFVQGDSTARWYYDATPVHDAALLASHCQYAEMIGYRHVALDYEGPHTRIDPALVQRIKRTAPSISLTVSDAVSATRAEQLVQAGVDTFILPSNVLEAASDPLALAHEYHARLLG